VRIRRGPAVILAIVLLPGAFFAGLVAVTESALFLSARQNLASGFLADSLERPVDVRGDVTVVLGESMFVRITEAFVAQEGENPEEANRFFDLVTFRAPYSALLGGRPNIRDFTLTGADIVVQAKAENRPVQAGNRADLNFAELPSTVLTNRFFDNVRLTDVNFLFKDPVNGWDEQVSIRNWRFETPSSREITTVELNAEINGQPIAFNAEVDRRPPAAAPDTVLLVADLVVPGVESRVQGNLDISLPVAAIDGELTIHSGSLADFLKTFGIAGVLDGKADFQADVSGPLDRLEFSDLDFKSVNSYEDVLTVTGTVDSGENSEKVDLEFALNFAPVPPDEAAKSFAIDLLGFKGNVTGNLKALSVQDLRVSTDIAALELGSIGPITIGRIVKGEDNKVSLEDIVIRHGPEGSPYFELEGRVGNLVEFRDVAIAGSYRLPTLEFLNVKTETPEELGFVVGDVLVGDAEGSLGLEKLTGAAVDTDLCTLSYNLDIPTIRRLDELTLVTEVAIPDFVPVLAALKIQTEDPPEPLAYEGKLGLSGGGIDLAGNLTSASSVIAAELSLKEPDKAGRFEISGNVQSDRLDPAHFAGLIDALQSPNSPSLDPDLEHIEIADDIVTALEVAIDLSIKELVAGGKRAGNVAGKLLFGNDRLSLAPLSLAYLGGTVKGTFALDFSKDSPVASAKGRIDKLQLAKLMNELGLKAPFSSTIYSSFDVTGVAKSVAGFAKSLSGSLTTSLWGGMLPTNVIDLSGLNLVTWMFTSSGNTSKLVCAVLPLHFKNGAASGKSMIIETENVQIVGGGTINLRKNTMDLAFVPRAKRKQLVEIVSPFELKGAIGDPKLTVKNAGAGRAIGETLSLPLNLLGHIFRGSGQVDKDAKPCRLPKATGPK
jgi:hypothetical protein